MRAAVQNIHHWDRQNARAGPTKVTKERKVCRRRGSVSGGKGNAEQRVRAQMFLVGRPIQLEQLGIDLFLGAIVKSLEGISYLSIPIRSRLARSLAAVTFRLAVTQFPSFVLPCACTAGRGCPSERSTFQSHIDFNGGIAARI